ncbi:MAG TPA: FAD-binding oxidoreductase [Candidatus Angelobacter sp.]|nr:FAD-binding oxidoreductase [Candidatus Angelobacter sp.]
MTTVATPTSLHRELAAIVGDDYVKAEEVEINGVSPAVSVAPASAEEIAAVLRLANERDLVVAPSGAFTRQQVGGIPERIDVLLQTERLNQIKNYDPGDLTVSVGAGICLADIQSALGEHQQWLPYDPPHQKTASMGGLLATAAFGPLKSGFGGLRDFCIGIQFVTGGGTIAKGGGHVVKNVAGYDLMKLMIGSYGSLAVITGANFKVFPRPRQTRTFVCSLSSLQEAIAFRNQVLHSPLTPICVDLVSSRALEYLCDPPVPHDPDDYVPAKPVSAPSKEWQLVVRVSGSDNVLARCRRELGSPVFRELEGASETQFWSWVSQFEFSVLDRHRNAMIVYAHSTIQNVEAVAQALERSAPDYNFLPAMVGRAATGNLVLAFLPLPVDPPAAMQYANCASALRALLPAGCSATVTHCPKEAKAHFDVWGSTPTDIELMRGVKRALDPKRILNRGRFIV